MRPTTPRLAAALLCLGAIGCGGAGAGSSPDDASVPPGDATTGGAADGAAPLADGAGVADADGSLGDASDSGDGGPDVGPCIFNAEGALDCDVVVVDVVNLGAAALVSYTVPIVLDTRPYVAAGKMKSDCSDLAPFGTDHRTPLAYWVSSAECGSPGTPVFVQIPSIPGGASARIYLAYGQTPRLTQDGPSIFVFFDDFDGTQLDETKWDHLGDGGRTVANGTLATQGANLLVGKTRVVAAGTTAVGVRESSNSTQGHDYELGAGTVTSVTNQGWLWSHERTGQWVSLVSYAALNVQVSGGDIFCANDPVSPSPLFDGQWHDVEFAYDFAPGGVTARWTTAGGPTGSHEVLSGSGDGGCLPAASEPVLLGLDHDSQPNSPVAQVDWVYVRTLAQVEPTVTVTPPAWVLTDAGSTTQPADAGPDASDGAASDAAASD